MLSSYYTWDSQQLNLRPSSSEVGLWSKLLPGFAFVAGMKEINVSFAINLLVQVFVFVALKIKR